MFKIVNKRVLNPSVVLMDIQAPFIAKKAKAGQFIIFRIDEQGESTQPVTIEDDVWVGANSVILPGVTLGKHCVVAAGSVVSRSIPAYSICAGCPAKVIKSYDFATKEWKKVK